MNQALSLSSSAVSSGGRDSYGKQGAARVRESAYRPGKVYPGRLYRWGQLAAFLLLSALAQSVCATDGPLDQVRATVDAVLEVVSDQDLQVSVKQEKIIAIVSKNFNFREMAQRTLATNWRKATPGERKRFIELFTRLLKQTYVVNVEHYSDASVTYRGERINGTRATVRTVIDNDGVKTPVDYRLRKKSGDGSWWVYDVVIEGVSLIATYRGEYREIVKNNGISGLLNELENKINSPAPVPGA